MDENDNVRNPLSDKDYQDLIALRVREMIRSDRQWAIRMLITTLVAVAGSFVTAWNANQTANDASEIASDASETASDASEIASGASEIASDASEIANNASETAGAWSCSTNLPSSAMTLAAKKRVRQQSFSKGTKFKTGPRIGSS